jgi:hypothetical protein
VSATTTENIKDIVRKKYGEAARMVKTTEARAVAPPLAVGRKKIPSQPTSTMRRKKGSFQMKRCLRRLGAETRQRSRN